MRKAIIALMLLVIPMITNAAFVCKDIWPNTKFPNSHTFYRCRNITDINEETQETKNFFNL